jgi:hypothetical protein
MGLLRRSQTPHDELEAVLPEQRTDRRDEISIGVSTFAELPDGSVLEGAVRDISDHGARIAGATDGLEAGDRIRIVFVVQSDQKVRYDCEIKHLNREERFYGVQFLSKPQPLDPEYQPATKEPEAPAALKQGCPRCLGLTMELGYMVEHIHLPGGRETVVPSQWAPGRPARGLVSKNGTPRPPGRMRVDTYRCTTCGHLEFYAVEAHA